LIMERTITQSAARATQHKADALIISGDATGDAPVTIDLDNARVGAGVPVIIGSGLDSDNASMLLNHCDGAIVGTALMKDKVVNAGNVKALLKSIERLKS